LYSEPAAATNIRFGSRGSIVIALIAPESRSPVNFQDAPLSRDTYIPVPSYVMLPPPGFGSPVPANTVPSGAVATAPIAWVLCAGQAGAKTCPASVLFHNPPLADAAYTTSRCCGSSARPTSRPPMLVGPTRRQSFAVAGICSACAAAVAYTCRARPSAPDVFWK